MRYDPDELTIGELEEAERLTGKNLEELFPAGKLTTAGARALAFLFERRTDPAYSWEDAADVKFATVVERMVAADPTGAADS